MARNVEIKAKAIDFLKQSEIARTLSGSKPETINQEDIFFNVSEGRLKLRIFSSDHGQLIYYNRSDQHGPTISNYEISETNDPNGLKSILESAYGVRNIVCKIRCLYMNGRTRIHFDQVDSLGEFIELEVVLSDSENSDDGEKEAHELMDQLGIMPDHLVKGAYIDLIEAQCV